MASDEKSVAGHSFPSTFSSNDYLPKGESSKIFIWLNFLNLNSSFKSSTFYGSFLSMELAKAGIFAEVFVVESVCS